MNRDEIPQDVALRRRDFFKESAAELNLLFKLLRKRKEAIKQVESVLVTISDKEDPAETSRKIQQIRSIIQGSQAGS